MTNSARSLLLLLLLLVVAVAHATTTTTTTTTKRDEGPLLSVSGVSSGADAATQFHVAFSETVAGAGLFAVAPFWCSQAEIAVAVESCCTAPELIDTTALIDEAYFAQTTLTIDALSHLSRQPVFIFAGLADTVRVAGVDAKAVAFYAEFNANVSYVDTYDAEHSWVTNGYGNSCAELGSPYINNCKFNGAHALLKHIYDGNHRPIVLPTTTTTATLDGQLLEFDQSLFTPLDLPPSNLSMDAHGYVFVPTACARSQVGCDVHISLHGCLQGAHYIGTEFAEHSGLNAIADLNRIIVVYPQAVPSAVVPYNPKGCWDWWGYTGNDFATKEAAQLSSFHRMWTGIDRLIASAVPAANATTTANSRHRQRFHGNATAVDGRPLSSSSSSSSTAHAGHVHRHRRRTQHSSSLRL